MSDDERTEQLQQTTIAVFNLVVNLGLIASVMGQYPEHVQEGFIERLRIVDQWANQMIEEVQSFGEAYDEETEAEDDDA